MKIPFLLLSLAAVGSFALLALAGPGFSKVFFTLSGAEASAPEVGVTGLDGSDAGPEALGFDAVTLKV